MIEPKPFASLTSGLLARKGGARPAMRRTYVPGSHAQPNLPLSVQEDLGWNDMGHDEAEEAAPAPAPLAMIRGDAPQPAPRAEAPPVVKQQEQLADQFPAPQPEPREAWQPAPMARPRGAKAAFTLRLDADRHLRLRLACAVTNRSAQQIVTQALDDFLNSQPQVEALAQQVPGTDGANPTHKP
jgi:predicted RNA-binding Zn ribbon-like protein